MQNPITLIIQAIASRITWLQQLQNSLQMLSDDLTRNPIDQPPTAMPASNEAAVQPAKARKKRKVRAVKLVVAANGIFHKPRAVKLAKAGRNSSSRGKGLTVADAFRQIFAGWSGEFSSATIREKALQQYPEIGNKIKTATAVTLAFLEEKGELIRVGRQGRNGIFKRAPKSALNALHAQIRGEVEAQQPAAE